MYVCVCVVRVRVCACEFICARMCVYVFECVVVLLRLSTCVGLCDCLCVREHLYV